MHKGYDKLFSIKVSNESFSGVNFVKIEIYQFGEKATPLKTLLLPTPSKGVDESVKSSFDEQLVKDILYDRICVILSNPSPDFSMEKRVQRLNEFFHHYSLI